jgi:hypothetical protein
VRGFSVADPDYDRVADASSSCRYPSGWNGERTFYERGPVARSGSFSEASIDDR